MAVILTERDYLYKFHFSFGPGELTRNGMFSLFASQWFKELPIAGSQ